MNPERLAELERQRALVRQHLAWLDREIAAASGVPVADVGRALCPPSANEVHHGAAPTTPDSKEKYFAAYEPDPVSAQANARRGCFLAFASAFFLLLLALGAIYFLRYRDHPLIFSDRAGASAEKIPPTAPRK